MGVYGGPDISESGLVLALDGANYKSFKGEVTTNLIPNPTVNAYPTTGNAWGTYNTNQYNAGSFFSIGSISSVSSNIITTSTNHPLRTYDVVRPQTTGGGVVENNDYFVKKLSDTTFTLHAYNSSQDGSQGYINPSTGTHKVYDSIATDTRISVNSTNFPTMWWGAPHLPNSGLVKELRYGEFNAIPNLSANDCIRLHYIRTDDVKDGMSYNVDCTVTPSSPVTISFYTRAANANAVGKVIQYYIYNYSGGNAAGYAWNFTLGALGVWERQTFTYTPAYGTMISYWFPQSSGVYSWDWSCMQVEQKSYVTNFVAGTRGSTVATGGGWADLSGRGNNGELVNGVIESADNLGALVFDGTNDYVFGLVPSTNNTNVTIIGFAEITLNTSGCIIKVGEGCAGYSLGVGNNYFNDNGNNIVGLYSCVRWISTGVSWNSGWNGFAMSIDSSGTASFYKNGSLVATSAGSAPASVSGYYYMGRCIGDEASASERAFEGKISSIQIYNRALTAAEIQQNFNANRSRFGI